MALLSRDPEKERYYLLPGMGGRAYRRKQQIALVWAIAIGLVVSGILAGLMYLLSSGKVG
jgi:hypothetical protein